MVTRLAAALGLVLASPSAAALRPGKAAPRLRAGERPPGNAPGLPALPRAAVPPLVVPPVLAGTGPLEASRAPSGPAAAARAVESALAGGPVRDMTDPRADKAAASRELFDLGLAAPAGEAAAVGVRSLDAWTEVDDWLRERLEPGLPAGRAAEWAREAAWRLRRDPSLGFEDAFAAAWTAAHGLDEARIEPARRLLADPRALDLGRELPLGLETELAGEFFRLLDRPEGVYAFGSGGVYLKRDGGDWTSVLKRDAYPVGDPGPEDPLLVSHLGRAAYEIMDGKASVFLEGTSVNRRALHRGREYVSTWDGDLLVRGAGGFERVEEVPGKVVELTAIGKDLYAGTSEGLHRLRGGRWRRIFVDETEGEKHGYRPRLIRGRLHVEVDKSMREGNSSWGETHLFRLGKGGATRILEQEGSIADVEEGPDGRVYVRAWHHERGDKYLVHDGAEWRRFLLGERAISLTRVDGELHLHTSPREGYRSYVVGRDGFLRLSTALEMRTFVRHGDARYLVSMIGLHRADGTSWVSRLADWGRVASPGFLSAASRGGRLYLATKGGILAADADLRPHPRPRWREELLESVGADVDAREAADAAAAEREDGDDSGRSLFSGLRRRRAR